jgi:hypothetical protein
LFRSIAGVLVTPLCRLLLEDSYEKWKGDDLHKSGVECAQAESH